MRSRRPALSAGAVAALLLLVLQLAGCGPLANPTACPASGCAAVPTALHPASPSTSAPALPDGFPVMDGAVAVDSPDPDVIATWRVDAVGSAAYDFYLSALPRAGLAVIGGYPSERSALIRFRTADGTILQLMAELSDGETLISVRPDRP